MPVAELRLRIDGARPPFAPRARWVLETFAEALGATPVWVNGPADLVYGPEEPSEGVWIPADPAAQAFFEGADAFPATATHRAQGLTLLFAPTHPDRAIPGDLVAGAFYLLARWDELHTPDRDRFDRLPLEASAFGRIAGLDLEEPAVEGYIAALRTALGLPAPTTWSVALTHDIDRIRRRTPKGLAGIARRRGPGGVARALAGPDPWNNIPDLLEAAWLRGVRPTVFLIGRNAHPLDGTPRRTYERERPALAAAVRAAGAEVGLHASFASSEDGDALAGELALLRGEVGPVEGVRFHYLRFRYHQTVRWLEAAGAGYDSSLGFSEAPGFAAGIGCPGMPAVRAHLWADMAYQNRLARFLENHDEPGRPMIFRRHCTRPRQSLPSSLPGLRFFHEGQLEGRRVKVSMHLGRRPEEPVDPILQEFYRKLLACLERPEVPGRPLAACGSSSGLGGQLHLGPLPGLCLGR